MGLKEKLRSSNVPLMDVRKGLFEEFGIIENPFPSAGQPSDHPRMEDDTDEKVVDSIREFERDRKNSQVIVIEGTQGVGKTNLLNYYQNELEDLYANSIDGRFYIIRYYPDPEQTFDGILKKIFLEMGKPFFIHLGKKLSEDGLALDNRLKGVTNEEVRNALRSLADWDDKEEVLENRAALILEWVLGLRIVNAHRSELGVKFRLDTIESKTQALRDLVMVSGKTKTLLGIFLLLDELEKHDSSQSKVVIVRYLLALRALIDALPNFLFLMLGITREARRRYFQMIPALASRLQKIFVVEPIKNAETAIKYYEFYLNIAQEKANEISQKKNWKQGTKELLSSASAKEIFSTMTKTGKEIGAEGVSQREYLNALHERAEKHLKRIQSSK